MRFPKIPVEYRMRSGFCRHFVMHQRGRLLAAMTRALRRPVVYDDATIAAVRDVLVAFNVKLDGDVRVSEPIVITLKM
jgi:hypothetical protein